MTITTREALKEENEKIVLEEKAETIGAAFETEDPKFINLKNAFYLPTTGKMFVYYQYLVLLNSIIVAITIPFRVAFENQPKWYSVTLEAYLNVVFLIDFIKHFLSPPSAKKTNN